MRFLLFPQCFPSYLLFTDYTIHKFVTKVQKILYYTITEHIKNDVIR